jgi:hypothetical protein
VRVEHGETAVVGPVASSGSHRHWCGRRYRCGRTVSCGGSGNNGVVALLDIAVVVEVDGVGVELLLLLEAHQVEVGTILGANQ